MPLRMWPQCLEGWIRLAFTPSLWRRAAELRRAARAGELPASTEPHAAAEPVWVSDGDPDGETQTTIVDGRHCSVWPRRLAPEWNWTVILGPDMHVSRCADTEAEAKQQAIARARRN